ncbi:ABC transporter ATP-binding protein [Marinobacterium nitratireducens]|uniref:ABC transporter ATP-binding protein n=1 Tax=Marinobacterium nitratireducens TaxID=518897 RepID=A0A917ZCC0_9GAMM|nr:ATP-binding cassette domain-containing protein [Marinobacterium nitratireducens]GGO80750.1 ABC transporter ATP-binding protein [Marinobacterium nitratireducens]
MTATLIATDIGVYDQRGERLLEPVSLQLEPGRPLVVLGETGSGKSLLSQALIGTLPAGLAASGRVCLGGSHLDAAQPADYRRLWGREVAVLPQEPWLSLDPLMRAQQQVAESHRLVRGLAPRAAISVAGEELEALGLAGALRRYPHQLSGGMAQRVAFAAARAGGARILIADEPTKGLDAARRDEVAALLMREVAAGGSLMVVTHDLALARLLGGEVLVVRRGALVERGDSRAIFEAPRNAYTRRLLAADPRCWQRTPPVPAGGPTVLQARDLGVSRGGRVLVEGLSLRLGAGEILGISGPSGCGKSSLGDALLGLHPPHAGTVVRSVARPQAYQKVFQDPPSAFARTLALGQAIADLVRRQRLDGSRVEPLMQRLRLRPELLARRPGEVSGGELQRLALLRAMLLDPVFLFADEPTSRLDPLTQQEVIGLLRELAGEGCAVMIVSHDPELIARTAHRCIVLDGAGAATVPAPQPRPDSAGAALLR